MKFRLKSINAKVVFLYLFLAIVNMSFFTIMVYENQIDLIMENSKYHMKELTEDLVSSLKKLTGDMEDSRIFSVKNKDDVIKEITALFETKITKKDKDAGFIIFTETGTVLYKSQKDLAVSKSDLKNGITAITNLDYSGRQMYSAVNEETYVISFYIPYKLSFLGDSIMLLKVEIKELKKRLDELYILILIIVCFIALFHAVFAVIFNRMFIRPIQSLHGKSIEISHGNLEARAEMERNDEIGELGAAFNSMADSIQEKINSLKDQNEKIEQELSMAGGVQKLIYPDLGSDKRFNYGLYHKSFGKVSGDYYDIIELDHSGRGLLLVDVSGHGMPAALVTMVVKEIFNRDAPNYPDPAELIKHMNAIMIDLLSRDDLFSGVYFTSVYMIIDKENTLHCCNAGHQKVLVLKRKERRLTAIDSSGGPVGIDKDMNDIYATDKMHLESGDRIYMFTDGIIEPKNADGKEFGMKGLVKSVVKHHKSPVTESVQKIADDLMAYLGDEKLSDDTTLFSIEIG